MSKKGYALVQNNPIFDLDESAFPVGAAVLVEAACRLFPQVSLIFSAIPSIASVWTLSHSVFWEPRAIIWGIRSDRKLFGVRQTATSPRFSMLEVWFSLQKGRSSVWKTRDSHSQCTVAICEAVLGLTDRRNGHSSNSQLP